MRLSALTDRAAVLAAMEECDALGREAFLAKHGFGPAKSYFVVHDRKRYDSKAIAGVAIGYQFPEAGPLRSAEFTGGEASVRRKLASLDFSFEPDTEVPTRNPVWTRDETILALDLYLKRRPSLPGKTDPEVVALSELLRRFAIQRGVSGGETFRNPTGVSMKISNLSRLEGSTRKGLPHGAGVEEQVWAEFMPDVAKVEASVAMIRASILCGDATSKPSAQDQGDVTAPVQVSRGPRPSFGEVVHNRTDGETCVYLMQLHGPLERLFPARDLRGMTILKVGRSNDVARRVAELNCGFPPGAGLTWKLVLAHAFASADAAHDVEQALLGLVQQHGFAIGGEFAIAPEMAAEPLFVAASKSLRVEREPPAQAPPAATPRRLDRSNHLADRKRP